MQRTRRTSGILCVDAIRVGMAVGCDLGIGLGRVGRGWAVYGGEIAGCGGEDGCSVARGVVVRVHRWPETVVARRGWSLKCR